MTTKYFFRHRKENSLDIAHIEMISILSEMYEKGKIDSNLFDTIKLIIDQEYQRKEAVTLFSNHLSLISKRLEISLSGLLEQTDDQKIEGSKYSEKFLFNRIQDTYAI